jgi:hypothetical protein
LAEPHNQVAEHAWRVMAFADTLRADLATSGRFRITPFDCAASPCSACDPALARRQARRPAPSIIHKMSTQVQWAKFHILDVNFGKRRF